MVAEQVSTGKQTGDASPRASSKWAFLAAAVLGVLALGALLLQLRPRPHQQDEIVPQSAVSSAASGTVRHPTLAPARPWVTTSDQGPLKKTVKCLRHKSHKEATHCMPATGCARHVIDDLASPDEVRVLRELIEWLVAEAWGGGVGPPSVVDLHQGSISYKDKFVLLHKLMEFKQVNFTSEQIDTYNAVRDRALVHVKDLFAAPQVLPEMTFFSHINASKVAQNTHDEYWHAHIDTEQYGTFAITTVLYLNDLGSDYHGGAFRFADDSAAAKEALGGDPGGRWSSVEPTAGRLVAFTSGRENVHRVEPVTSGVRLALTMAFTCNANKAASVSRWEGGGGSMHAEAQAEEVSG